MSLHSSASTLPLRRASRSAVPHRSTDPKLFAAVALLVAVLIADALLIWAAVPGLADLASFYVSTT
jgi:hypothetical protein